MSASRMSAFERPPATAPAALIMGRLRSALDREG